MIKTTVGKLVSASQGGCLARFLAIPKTIAAGHKNRKMPAAIREEMKLYAERIMALITKHGGVQTAQGASTYTFPAGIEPFQADENELKAQEIELPGEPMKLDDLLAGGLLEDDYDALGPFLAE